jgi:cell division protein FtsB
MDKPTGSSAEEAKLKDEIRTLRKRIQMLEAEIQRLRQKVVNAWGEA